MSLSRVRLFATPWTAAHQALLSMGILQVRILELPHPPPGDLANSGIESRSAALQADSLSSELPYFLSGTALHELSQWATFYFYPHHFTERKWKVGQVE